MCFFKIFVFICVVISMGAGNPYCDITCEGEAHTMCTYEGVGAACKGATGRRLTDSAKHALLTEHNDFRSAVATGKVAGLPKARDMKKMYWDKELETIAQRWADQCTFGHDKCRSLLSNEPAGQNIYIKMSSSDAEHPFEMKGWKDEAMDATIELIAAFGNSAKVVGHFTQMAWADTYRLGCALSVYKDDASQTRELIVCNYAPAGNWAGAAVYKTGEPCSECFCSGCFCSSRFVGLCVQKGDVDVAGVHVVNGALILVTSLLVLVFT